MDQRIRHRSRIHLPLGRGTAHLVGQWTVIPDRSDGSARYRSQAESSVRSYIAGDQDSIRKYAHGIFILLNLINNIFGCGGMILAGAQLVSGMTGMHIAAAGILIPAGGMKVGT